MKAYESLYLFVTKNTARPESLNILSIGTIAISSMIYLGNKWYNEQVRLRKGINMVVVLYADSFSLDIYSKNE